MIISALKHSAQPSWLANLKGVILPAVVLAGLSTITAGKALAADDDGDNSSGNALEEVIVQALRRDASLQDTPIAVSVLSQQALDNSDVVDITDLNNIIPNLVVQTPADQANPRIFLRGVGTVNGTEAADQSVGFYVDDIFAARAQGALSLFYDLESVQLLRGPQGTLFGRNNSAGAFLLRTKRPTKELEGNFELTSGSFNRRRVSAAISIPLTDNWSMRVAGVVDVDEGWVKQLTLDPRFAPPSESIPEEQDVTNPYSLGAVGRYPNPNQKLNNRDSRSVRISSLAEFNSRSSWFFSIETFNNKSADSILLNPVLVKQGKYEAYIDSPHSLDLTNTAIRSNISVDIGSSSKFEYLLGASNLSRAQVYDVDAGLMQRFQENRTEWQRSRAASQEFKFTGSVNDGKFDWTAGIYAFAEKTGIRFDIDAINAWPEGGATFIQPERGAVAAALYGQFTYRPIESLGISLGLRITDETKFDRRGRNYNNACNGFILRETGQSADKLNGGSAISTAEDFFNNRTGARTRNLDGSAVVNAAGDPIESDGIDDVSGLPIRVFTDEFDNETQTAETDAEDKTPDGLDDADGLPNTLLCTAGTQNELERSYEEVSWLFRVDYKLSGRNETLLYLSAATGYQSGVIQDNGNSTKPENSLSYEFGTKTDFGSVRLNSAIFFNNYTDLIRSLIDPIQNNTVVTNASEAQIFGVELEMNALVGNGGQIDVGLSYLSATYTGEYLFAQTGISTDLPQGANPSLPTRTIPTATGEDLTYYNLDGGPLPYAPEIQFNMGFNWDIKFDGGSLIPRFRVVYSSEFSFNDRDTQISAIDNFVGGVDQGLAADGSRLYTRANPEGQDAYFKMDIGLEWVSRNGWSLDMFFNNVTDELVKTSADCSAGTAEGCAARYLAPAESGLRFRWVFD